MAAVLHDVLEDTSLTVPDLQKLEIPFSVIRSVKELTRWKNPDGANELEFKGYIAQLGEDPIARKVKLCDLEDNMDLTRVAEDPEQRKKVLSMAKRYTEAWAYLQRRERRIA